MQNETSDDSVQQNKVELKVFRH